MSLGTSIDEAKAWTQFHKQGHSSSLSQEYEGTIKEFWRNNIIDLLQYGASTLDAGCGNFAVNRIMSEFVSNDIKMYAIDIADTYHQLKPNEVSFSTQSIEQCSFEEQTFGLVTSCYSIEYTDLRRSLNEIHRVLQVGGIGIFLIHSVDSRYVLDSLDMQLFDCKLIDESNIFTLMHNYCIEPSSKTYSNLRRCLELFICQSDLRDRVLIRTTVNFAKQLIESKDLSFLSNIKDNYFFDIKRRELLINAAIKSRDFLKELILNCGFQAHKLEKLRAPSGNILGWQVIIEKV